MTKKDTKKKKKLMTFGKAFDILHDMIFADVFDFEDKEKLVALNYFSHESLLHLFIFSPSYFKAINEKYNNLDIYKLDKKDFVLCLRDIVKTYDLPRRNLKFIKNVKQPDEDEYGELGNIPIREKKLLYDILKKQGDIFLFESTGLLKDDNEKRTKKHKEAFDKSDTLNKICSAKYDPSNIESFVETLESKIIDNLNYVYDLNMAKSKLKLDLNMDYYDSSIWYIEKVYLIINEKKINIDDIMLGDENCLVINCTIKDELDKIKNYLIDTFIRTYNLKEHQVHVITGNTKIKKTKDSKGCKFRSFKFNEKEGYALAINQIYSVKIPDMYYSDDFILVEVQKSKWNLVYIFRHKDGTKHLVKTNQMNYYYADEHGDKSYPARPVQGLITYKIPRETKVKNFRNYETEIPVEIRHMIDYFYVKGEKAVKTANEKIEALVAYWDIETDTSIYIDLKDTMNQADAAVTYISYRSETAGRHVFVFNPENKPYRQRNDLIIHSFATEEEMLLAYVNFLYEDAPDILCAWNAPFDVSYTHTRIRLYYPKLLKVLEKYGPVDMYRAKAFTSITWPSIVIVDLCEYYKSQNMGEIESYALSFVTAKELVKTKDPKKQKWKAFTKLDMPAPNDSIDKWVDYNIRDTDVLYELNHNKMDMTGFRNMLRLMSKCPWKKILASSNNIKAFLWYRYKLMNMVVRDLKVIREPVALKGGFNQHTEANVYNYFSDLDAKAMYPSLMRTYNIGWDTYVMKIPERLAVAIIFDKIKSPPDTMIDITFKPFICNMYGRPVEKQLQLGQILRMIEEHNLLITFNGGLYQSHETGHAITYDILNELINDRDIVKATVYTDLEDGTTYYNKVADNIQKTLKTLANAFYGVMGFGNFPLSHGDLINSVTYTGRFYIKAVMYLVDAYLCIKKDNPDFIPKDFNVQFYHDELYENINIHPQNDLSHLTYVKYADSVAGDSEILIRRNNKLEYINIDDLFTKVDQTQGEKEYCYIRDVETITLNDQGKTIWKNIPYIMRHKISSENKKVYRVWNNNTTYLDVTEDHSVFTYLPKCKKHKVNIIGDRFIETKPKELLGKSLITFKKDLSSKKEEHCITLKVWELIGLLLGDGYWGGNTRNAEYYLQLSSGFDYDEIVEKVLIPLKKANIVSNYYPDGDKGDIKILSKKLSNFMKLFKQDKVKFIPEFVFNLSGGKLNALLRGLFTADGTTILRKDNRNCEIKFANVNDNLIKSVSNMLYIVGIPCTIITDSSMNNYNGVYSDTYTKYINIKNKQQYKDNIGFILNRKQDKIRILEDNNKKNIQAFDFDFANVKKVEEIEFNDYVYDIEVNDTHRFFANNVLVHNTDGCMIFLEDFVDNVDACYPYLKEINDIVNNKIIPYIYQLTNAHLSKEDERYMLFKDEWVAERGLLYEGVAKKYCVYITRKHGKVVDEVEIRKNIIPNCIPQISRKKLRTLIEDYILKPDVFDMDAMWNYINDTTDEYRQCVFEKSKRIAKPVSLKKKIDMYNKGTVPEHIDGMLLYNHLISEEWNGFQKGYLFKIHGFDVDKMPSEVFSKYKKLQENDFNVMVGGRYHKLRARAFVILTEEELPDWVILDEDKIINSLWSSRYEDVISPLDKVVSKDLDFSF